MAWDKTLPIEGALAPTYNNIMRADKTALEAALNAYMYFLTGGTQTGQPRQGSARPYFQDTAPTTRLDGDHFDSTDLGTPWIDSNSTIDNQYNILTAADGAGTNTWTPISTEVIAVLLAANRIFAGTLKSTGNFTVGANKVVVTAANGNTAIAGTLGATGIATLAKGSLLAASDAPTTDAMIACKKYIDDLIAAEVTARSFGVYTNLDDDENAMLKSHAYLAKQDGVVTARMAATIAQNDLKGYIGSTSDPAGAGDFIVCNNSYGTSEGVGITFPVAKDKYFEVTDDSSNATAIRWHPIGTLIKCTDQD